MDPADQLSPATARKVFLWNMALAAILLAAIATSNAFTTLSDRARDGIYLPIWAPVTWEFSSALCIWLLIPAVGWWLKQFPLTRPGWPRSLPAHLLATLPFSLIRLLRRQGEGSKGVNDRLSLPIFPDRRFPLHLRHQPIIVSTIAGKNRNVIVLLPSP